MGQQLVLLLAGFLLTTVLGGVLAAYLQTRTWRHQNDARLAEESLRRAGEVCQAVSRLMDKRLYRMLRLFYTLRASTPSEDLEQKLQAYNEVLYEWNDSLNVNLALVGTYFGTTARDWLEDEVYESYQRAGRMLEDLYRQQKSAAPELSTSDASAVHGLEQALLRLNDQVYRLGVFMMGQLRAGTVGSAAPSPMARPAAPAAVHGRAVPLAGLRETEDLA